MWRSKLQTEVVKALKAGDSERVEVIRYLISLIDKKALTVEVGKMTEADEMGVLWKEMKNKQEAREMFAKAGRQELADKSDKEIKILAEFLPWTSGKLLKLSWQLNLELLFPSII